MLLFLRHVLGLASYADRWLLKQSVSEKTLHNILRREYR